MEIQSNSIPKTDGNRIRSSMAAAAAIFLLTAFHVFSQTAEVRLQRIDITDHPEIQLFLTVTDQQGNSVLGLTGKELRILVDGVDQNIMSVESAFEGSETLAVALMFDRSGSMRNAMGETKAAAFDFIDRMSISDEMAVISFDDTVVIQSEFSKDRSLIREAIESIRIGRDTSLYDAVLTALGLFDEVPNKRRAVIVLSDGKDTRSQTDKKTVLQKAQERSIPIFTINLGPEADTETLRTLSQGTGGYFFNALSSGELLSLYQRIAEQLNNQYKLSFRSSFSLDEKFHTLKVVYENPSGEMFEKERDYVASQGPGIRRETVAGFERNIEKQNILLGLGLGSFFGLLLGLLILLIIKAVRPETAVFSFKGIGLLLTAMLFGAIIGTLFVLWP